MADLTVRILRNTELYKPYEKLLLGQEISYPEKRALLQIAVLLLNDNNQTVQMLGYRIIVLYSNHTSDYVPLYDVALNKGYIPLSKILENEERFSAKTEENFFNSFHSSLAENYRSGKIYRTEEQMKLSHFFRENTAQSVAVVAPTSYGKSELFIDFCNSNQKNNICILVPTKALLAQTKRRLLEGISEDDDRKIITHPEMYVENDENIIAVLTQERLLRLFQKFDNVIFDHVFVDEAHNLLGRDQRSLLLAKVIVLLNNRHEKVAFKYLTPFLIDVQNISTRYTQFKVEEFKVHESLKTEKFYLMDFRNGSILNIYDQYFDQFSESPSEKFTFLLNALA